MDDDLKTDPSPPRAEDALSQTPEPERGAYRWYVLFVLTAIFTVHYIDRTVMSVVIEPIKAEFGLSDSALGLLSGLAHSGALSLLALPMGWFSDRTNRVRMVSGVVMIWSAITALGALAAGYWSLLFMRMGVGAAEAGGPPASVSIIGDLFERRELPTAMGVYYLAMGLGTGLIFLVGGYVAEFFGWRAVFLIAGIPGFFLGLILLFTVREPHRRSTPDGTKAPGLKEVVKALSTNKGLLFIILAGTSASLAQAALLTWMGPFLIRSRDLSLGEAGVVMAIAAAGGKTLGSLLAGVMTRVMARDRIREFFRFPSLMLLLSLPTCWIMVWVDSVALSILFAILLSVILGCWSGQVTAIVMTASPLSMRGTATSTYWLMANLVGVGLGPLVIGLISDLAGSLGTAMAIATIINAFAAVFFYLSCRNVREEEDPVSAA
ncbi:spinster family MFS transporter [Hyphomonas sp.]|uniref:spinster family MFS transporter n=1 Tax=Hyphomonas sp. TaxID=87 RepID=UPI003002AE36